MNRIKKGDTVAIITGRDKGQQGIVEKILDDNKIMIAGKNMVKKNKKSQGNNSPGGIIEMPAPIPESNVMLVCPNCNLKTRIGFTLDGDAKMRVCKQCNKNIK